MGVVQRKTEDEEGGKEDELKVAKFEIDSFYINEKTPHNIVAIRKV